MSPLSWGRGPDSPADDSQVGDINEQSWLSGVSGEGEVTFLTNGDRVPSSQSTLSAGMCLQQPEMLVFLTVPEICVFM